VTDALIGASLQRSGAAGLSYHRQMTLNFSKSIAQAASAGLMLGAMTAACGGSTTPAAASPAATAEPEAAAAGAKACCKGKNECKGQGGCKTASNECAGQNACKSKGGCNGHCPKE
jgi:hypothetical protein